MGWVILTVCTANICRSPSLQLLLNTQLAAVQGAPAISVSSAGVDAVADRPLCEASAFQLQQQGITSATILDHRSRLLTCDIAESADLILTADRGHRSRVLGMCPSVRSRIFTMRQAAALASWIVNSGYLNHAAALAAGTAVDLPYDDPLSLASPLPADIEDRLSWLVEEMDANRGVNAQPPPEMFPHWESDDIGDPHEEGWSVHEYSFATIYEAVTTFVDALSLVTSIQHS